MGEKEEKVPRRERRKHRKSNEKESERELRLSDTVTCATECGETVTLEEILVADFSFVYLKIDCGSKVSKERLFKERLSLSLIRREQVLSERVRGLLEDAEWQECNWKTTIGKMVNGKTTEW